MSEIPVLDLTLGPGATFLGRVLDREGNPVVVRFLVKAHDVRPRSDWIECDPIGMGWKGGLVEGLRWYEGDIRVCSTGAPIGEEGEDSMPIPLSTTKVSGTIVFRDLDPPPPTVAPKPTGPTFEHDRECCLYTGSGRVRMPLGDVREFDFYFCLKCPGRSVIARHGDEPEEYTSVGTALGGFERVLEIDPRLRAAYEAAERKGLVGGEGLETRPLPSRWRPNPSP